MTESEDSRAPKRGPSAMTEAQRLRRQARRALELARDITDEDAARALKAHAADLLERAEAIERQGET